MSHGKNISVNHAIASIRKFVQQEIQRTGKEEKKIVVGHRIELSLIKTMMAEIDKLNDLGQDIDSLRIYFGIDDRNGRVTPEEYDVILVPTHSSDEDLHTIYKLQNKEDELPTLIGNSTPCPNVCEQKTLNC